MNTVRSIVLETSAVLALLFGKPWADEAIAPGRHGIWSTVSYSEAVAKSLERKVPMETIAQSLASL